MCVLSYLLFLYALTYVLMHIHRLHVFMYAHIRMYIHTLNDGFKLNVKTLVMCIEY